MPDQRGGSRAARVIAQLYYYVAAVIGVGLLLGGVIAALLAIRTIALPQEFQTTRDGVRQLLHGLAFALPGAAVFWWHLREARTQESEDAAPTFWGKALYYHLVALIALGFVLGGTVKLLVSAGDAAVPFCFDQFAYPAPAETGPSYVELEPLRCQDRSEGLRGMLDGFIVVVAATPLFLWHLREGRRADGLVPRQGPQPAG
jgi:hypothetical protein